MNEKYGGYSFYSLRKIYISPTDPKNPALSTAAVHFCSLCGGVISGMSGPGDRGDICAPCGDDIKAGLFMGAVKRDPETNKAISHEDGSET